jgi:hypothetical protein
MEASIEDLPELLKKHWLNAPCMLEYVTEVNETAALETGDEGDWELSRNFPSTQPPEWVAEVSRLDRLPLAFSRQGARDRFANEALVEFRKAEMANDEEILAPVAADPLHESLTHFIQRARDHYRARRMRLAVHSKRGGLPTTPARSTPDLGRHVEWLLRFQLDGASPRAIAKASNLHGLDQGKTVYQAIKKLAMLIDLPLRRGRSGRPSKRK